MRQCKHGSVTCLVAMASCTDSLQMSKALRCVVSHQLVRAKASCWRRACLLSATSLHDAAAEAKRHIHGLHVTGLPYQQEHTAST